MKPWWALASENVIKELSAHAMHGLSTSESATRLSTYGYNQLTEAPGRTAWDMFIDQFKDFIIWVLIGAAVIAGFLGEWVDTGAIIAIVILNAILGFVQEHRAEKSLAALKKLSNPSSKVIRDGKHLLIPSQELVPGDLIELEAGDYVPADSRLMYTSAQFATQEASLTGESLPIRKHINPLPTETALADRKNMVYMGTPVVSGKAKAIVVETGMRTELGAIAGMIQTIESMDTPLQRKLEQFGKWIVYVCFIVVALVFILGLLRGGNVVQLFLTAVSLAVAAIPEGLPAVVTVSLALGVQKMVRRHVLIRKLPAVETLGCATVICSDKTGTLTRNEMTVQYVVTGENLFTVTGIGYEPKGTFLVNRTVVSADTHSDLYHTLTTAVLCNGAGLMIKDGAYQVVGDPTEGALIVAAEKYGIIKQEAENTHPFVEEIPFDSDRKKMTIVRKDANTWTAYVKGAPEQILRDSTHIRINGNITPLTDELRARIITENTNLAHKAMRVLAIAYRPLDNEPQDYSPNAIEKNLIFLGLIAMIDPPREEVKRAIQECKAASIKTIMITGDNKETAAAIATELGFFTANSLAITGDELSKMSDDELKKNIERIAVYARVSPEHKFRIVKTLRHTGHVVAMTGDGVNDAPAIKEADIGVAMGITGTDVTKEVSDMIITDDNFASIVAAVEEGRTIYDNIKKFIHFLLSCNAGEILVMFTASLVGLPAPLLPIHILWVNLVTDGFPALALGVDPKDPKSMQQPPRKQNEGVITKERGWIMLMQGALIALCSLGAFLLEMDKGLERARTAAFIVLAASQLFHAFNCRSLTESIFTLGFGTNKKLIGAVLFSFFLLMIVVYVPFLQTIFKTLPLSFIDWLVVIGISSLPLWIMELVKIRLRAQNS